MAEDGIDADRASRRGDTRGTMRITGRTPRQEYEHTIAPRGLFRIMWQKTIHILARFCIPGELRVWLYGLMGASVGRGVFIGLDTYLDDQFPELIRIEDEVGISFRVTIVVHDDSGAWTGDPPCRLEGTVAPVVLRRGCYLGAGCVVLPGVTVGERAVVGAGAVVTKDVPAGKVVVGVPARVVRDAG
jgi:acetyltransferase-like isoleucine patch superfamily enzyme